MLKDLVSSCPGWAVSAPLKAEPQEQHTPEMLADGGLGFAIHLRGG